MRTLGRARSAKQGRGGRLAFAWRCGLARLLQPSLTRGVNDDRAAMGIPGRRPEGVRRLRVSRRGTPHVQRRGATGLCGGPLVPVAAGAARRNLARICSRGRGKGGVERTPVAPAATPVSGACGHESNGGVSGGDAPRRGPAGSRRRRADVALAGSAPALGARIARRADPGPLHRRPRRFRLSGAGAERPQRTGSGPRFDGGVSGVRLQQRGSRSASSGTL